MEDDRDILDDQEEGPAEELAPEPAGSSLYKQTDQAKKQLSKTPSKDKAGGLKDGKDKLAKGAEKGGKKAAGAAEELANKGTKALPPQAKIAAGAATAAYNAARGKKTNKSPLFALLFIVICIISLVVIVPSFAVFYFLKTPPSDASETTIPDIPTTGELLTPPNLGSPNEHGYYQLPPSTDGAYTIYSCANHRYGSIELVKVLYTVGTNWAKKYPDHKIKIGDLNAAEGHVSHNNGIDVDVIGDGLMMTNKGYRPDLTTELAMMFFETRLIQFIFYDDPSVDSAVNAWAKLKGYPGQMRVIGGHGDHFHVRLNIPKGPFHDPYCKG